MNDTAWPLWTMELTPSSGSADSFPIEVGVACWTGPTASITTWSTPINPYGTADWDEIHQAYLDLAGLDPAQLRQGMTPADLAQHLNDVFLTSTVHGRSGTVDVHLANRLNLAARVWPTYSLCSWRAVCDRHPDQASSAWDIISRSSGGAAARACATMKGIAHLMGHDPQHRQVPTMAVSLPI